MSARHRRRLGAVAVCTLLALPLGATPTAVADPGELTATGQLTASARTTGAKAASSALAKTDPALLGRTDATPVQVMLKLDYDAAASYAGGVAGLAATSPSVTGEPLSGESAAEEAYDAYARALEAQTVAALERAVPQAEVGQSFRIVYGGVAATIPANTVSAVLDVPGVVAVQADEAREVQTDSSIEFIGAPTLYAELGTTADAGEGIIYGNLDGGVWPEHPSFADQGNLAAPPPTASGEPRACEFGDNPLTPAVDVFACQDKLIGGAYFTQTYDAVNPPGDPQYDTFAGTARDGDGHGTHTSSTTAGNVLDSAPVYGVEQGPVQGVAPGAWLMVYKVCGISGSCFVSDSAAAVEQAVLDGVDVINFSVGGGEDPFTDPVELAFLDAYAAGVFVSTSAGNDGPGAATSGHLSPWVTTVAASTQTREFGTTLQLRADDGDTFSAEGVSITAGVGEHPLVLASAAPYGDALCQTPAPAGSFEGKIVACQRGGNARVSKGYNVLQGGAEAMVLYNPTLADAVSDNHWLPTVHLPDGGDFLAFTAAHTGVVASFGDSEKREGQGDVIAAFSSRGPGGLFIKPDVTAPGVQILAGASPNSWNPQEGSGPPGEYFQAIAGTSMSSPHVAGAAVLLMAAHPDWTPGQVKSALMTTARQDVVKEDLVTPADPLDMGSGHIDLTVASTPGITFAQPADGFYALASDPLSAVDLNLPSVNVPELPGRLTTTRVAQNTTDKQVRYDVTTSAEPGTTITVTPSSFRVPAGGTRELTITIETAATSGSQFGEIVLTPTMGSDVTLHLPVAFTAGQGDVSLSQTCDPTSIPRRGTTTCEVTATNQSFAEATVDVTTEVTRNLRVVGVDGATQDGGRRAGVAGATLAGATAGVPSVGPDPGNLFGYIPLDAFGIAPTAIGDEEIINFNVPAFVYNGVSYTSVGVDSNGYLVAGGGTSEDNNCCNLPTGPSPAPPNDVLAPFWTDLDGTGAPGIYAGTLTDGVGNWLVIEHRVNVFGTTDLRRFQTWIGLNGVQDVQFAYAAPPAAPAGQPFLVGAENEFGQGEMAAVLPTEDLRVTSTDPAPGGSLTYTVTVAGVDVGTGQATTELDADTVSGTTVVRTPVEVTP